MSSPRDPDAKNPRLFDVRTVERNIKKGLITRKDYEKFLKSLNDSAEKVHPSDEPSSAGPSDGVSAGDDDDDDDTDDDGDSQPA